MERHIPNSVRPQFPTQAITLSNMLCINSKGKINIFMIKINWKNYDHKAKFTENTRKNISI